MKRQLPQRMPTRDVVRFAERIGDVTFWAVELWPRADPRCFLQDDNAPTHAGLDDHPLSTAKLFAEHVQARKAATVERRAFPEMKALRPTPIRVRKTNTGAEALLNYRFGRKLHLLQLAAELGVGERMAHGLCYGLTLPSLPLAGRIHATLQIGFADWLEQEVTDWFPALR